VFAVGVPALILASLRRLEPDLQQAAALYEAGDLEPPPAGASEGALGGCDDEDAPSKRGLVVPLPSSLRAHRQLVSAVSRTTNLRVSVYRCLVGHTRPGFWWIDTAHLMRRIALSSSLGFLVSPSIIHESPLLTQDHASLNRVVLFVLMITIVCLFHHQETGPYIHPVLNQLRTLESYHLLFGNRLFLFLLFLFFWGFDESKHGSGRNTRTLIAAFLT
jgi:hypothetical protein